MAMQQTTTGEAHRHDGSTSAPPRRSRTGAALLLVATLLGGLLAALPASPAAAEVVLDVEVLPEGGMYGESYWLVSNSPGGFTQTFTPTRSGVLTNIAYRLPARSEGEPFTNSSATISVRATDASGAPTGPVLGQGQAPGGTGAQWLTATIGSDVSLVAGRLYAFSVQLSSGAYGAGVAYAGGTLVGRTDDLAFRTFVDTSRVEPHLTNTSPGVALRGDAYSYDLGLSGAPAATATDTAGSLPPGLGVDTGGVLSGTPTEAGTYAFVVIASNAFRTTTSPTITVVVREREAPGAPTGVSAVAEPRAATVSWAAAPPGDDPVTGYTVTASPGGAGCTSSGLSCRVTGLEPGGGYTFTVVAANANGSGPASDASASVTLPGLPGQPTSFTGSPGDGTVLLSWAAPVSDGGSPVEGYELQQHDGDDQWSEPVVVSSPHLVTDLENAQHYSFRVRTVTAVGASGYTELSAIPYRAPDAPSGLVATPGDGEVDLAWTAPFFNGGAGVTGYALRYRVSGAEEWSSAPWYSGGTWATVSGLDNGTEHEFQVAAVNLAGSGQWTPSALATPATVPSVPLGLVAEPDDRTLGASWSAPGYDGGAEVLGYEVQVRALGADDWIDAAAVTSAPTPQAPVLLGALENGVAHEVRVAAVNRVGLGPWSEPFAATPRTVPSAPASTSVVPGNGSVLLSWPVPADGGAGIEGYAVQSRLDGQEVWSAVSETASAEATVTDLDNGAGYEFRVAARNAAGLGAWGPVVAATPRTVPQAPVLLSAVPADGSVGLGWSAPADDGGAEVRGYEIEYRPAAAGDSESTGEGWTPVPAAEDAAVVPGEVPVEAGRVEGLPNGEPHEFRVRAVNVAGSGAWSEPLLATPFRFAPVFTGADGTPLGGDPDDRLELQLGAELEVSAEGLPEGAELRLELHSEPILLGQERVAPAGSVVLAASVPAGAPLGEHELVATLEGTGAEPVSVSLPVTVVAVPVEPEPVEAEPAALPEMGAVVAPLALCGLGVLLAGLALLLAARSRRRLS